MPEGVLDVREGWNMRLIGPAMMVAAGLMLAGCQGSVTTDLSADAPADPDIVGVNVDLRGVEFQKSDGTTEAVEFTASERTDLIELLEGGSSRLLTDEEIPDGTYTGIRLLFEDNDDASVDLADGRQFPAVLQEGDFALVDFTIEEDEATRSSLVLTLDLRKSLSFDDDEREYTFKPALRAVDEEDAGDISGSVDVSCPSGTSLQEGGAVYLFTNEDVEPSDIGGAIEPYATTAVISNFDGSFDYSLRFLAPGDYTISVTCEGNEDDPNSAEDLRFRGTANVTVDADSVTHNFD